MRPALDRRERAAVAELLERVRERGWPPLLRAALFGSKARGDYDGHSDVDVLVVCDVAPEARAPAGELVGRIAEGVAARSGVRLEPWTVCADDLRPGQRTPMLVDAVHDAVPLWPPGAPPLRARFMPADAVFCASRLLEWVEAGGAVTRRALQEGCWAEAAARARDDIVRLATAALLLAGDTRHRRVGSLRRFDRIFVRGGYVPPAVRPALAWAAAAYPPDGGRGHEDPPASPRALRTAPLGYELAGTMAGALMVPILRRIAELDGQLS